MGVIQRFKDIMSANINAVLDKAEDPEKMIDQYMRNLQDDLGKVKAETAAVMAEETRAKRELDECNQEVERILDEGYTSDEIMIMKSISPEFNYYELYLPEYANDGRICIIQNVNDNEFFIINSELNTDPNLAQ